MIVIDLRVVTLPDGHYEGKPSTTRRRAYAIFAYGGDVVLDGRAYETYAYANALRRTRYPTGEVRLVKVAHR